MSDPRLIELRSKVAAHFAGKDLYYSLALLSSCNQVIVEDLPSIAGITNVKGIHLMVHPVAVEAGAKDPRTYAAMMMHEVMHLAQIDSLANMLKVVDLTPIRDVCVRKKQEATEQAAKDRWNDFINQIDEEIDENKSTWANRTRKTAANIGLDVTANKAVEISFPGSVQKISDLVDLFAGKPREDLNRPDSLWTLDSLSYTVEKPLPKDKDWWFYICEYIEFLARKLDENNPADNPPPAGASISFVSGEPGEGEGGDGGGQDSHDFNTKSDSVDRQQLKEAVARAMEEGKLLAHQAGKSAADSQFIATPEPLSEKIESLLRLIKVRFTRLFAPSNDEVYRFERDNRKFPGLDFPGLVTVDNPQPSVAMVLDTSGSMWNTTMLNQMVAAARRYNKKGQLSALYCCDTVLTQISYDHSFSRIELKGGGGTIFSSDHIEQIVSDLKAGKGNKPDIIYLTDEAVFGLDSARQNKKARLHVINVERAIGNSYG
jgi:predicted metal-dependent peptidase